MSKITEKLDSLIENFVGDQSTNEEFERAQEFANQVFILAMDAQRDAIGVLKAQLAQYQSDDYVLVQKEVPEHIAENLAKEIVLKPNLENDHVLFDLQNKVYEAELDRKKWELYRDYRDMIEAQEQYNG